MSELRGEDSVNRGFLFLSTERNKKFPRLFKPRRLLTFERIYCIMLNNREPQENERDAPCAKTKNQKTKKPVCPIYIETRKEWYL